MIVIRIVTVLCYFKSFSCVDEVVLALNQQMRVVFYEKCFKNVITQTAIIDGEVNCIMM